MKKTLGKIVALSLLIALTTGCASKEVIPITSNCDKLQKQSSNQNCCKLITKEGCLYMVNEDRQFSFKVPKRWSKKYAFYEKDLSDKGELDYTLTIQYLPSEKNLASSPKADLMSFQVMSPAQWDHISKEKSLHNMSVLAKSDNAVYLVAIPSQNPFAAKSLQASEFSKMNMDLKEIKKAFSTPYSK